MTRRAAADTGAVRRGLVVVMAILVAAACAAPSPPGPTGPPDIAFTPVALPGGAVPEALAADGDQLLVGVQRAAAPQPPKVLNACACSATPLPEPVQTLHRTLPCAPPRSPPMARIRVLSAAREYQDAVRP